ncbi:MAG: hypothetical protein AAB468_01170 [Patescibacteria group bacterium]
MTQIIFKYDLGKDTENFIRGTRAKNSSKPTRLQEVYVAQNGTDYDEVKVKEFLESYANEISLDPNKAVKELEESWKKIEKTFLQRIETMFKITYPTSQITAYLTTNQRCTYNIPENYFFVNFTAKSSNHIIMHELFHFYTWYTLHDDLVAAGIDENQYNNIKESLTILLNTEFLELMNGAHDEGYPQHVEMREKVQELWSSSKNIREVASGVFSLPNPSNSSSYSSS